MKKLTAFLLAFLCLFFVACNTVVETEKTITCDDVIAAYEDAGYEIFHKEATEQDEGEVCYVKATDIETDEYIFFYFFETHEEAVAYGETRQYNVLIWLFSVIYGDPSWQTTKVYNNIEIEYDKAYLYEPFQELIRFFRTFTTSI